LLRSLTLFAIQNPHPLKIAKGAAPKTQRQSQKRIKIKKVLIATLGLHSNLNPHPLKIAKGAAPEVKIKNSTSKSKTNQNQKGPDR
jgi:preprotein translocase subunit SecB